MLLKEAHMKNQQTFLATHSTTNEKTETHLQKPGGESLMKKQRTSMARQDKNQIKNLAHPAMGSASDGARYTLELYPQVSLSK